MHIAIGHSTNLIGREDNIVVVRGGGEGSAPVYAQMLNAVEQFFPESGILQEDAVELEQQTSGMPLQRFNSGVSSLVGHGNGQRPGGFVLVIDGAALTHVRLPLVSVRDSIRRELTSRISRRSETRNTSTCCCGSRCSARA